jgi:hypothetical protein
LRDVLDQARRGTLPGLVRTGATVANAAAEYLRYIEHDRVRKPSTVQGYRWIVDARVIPELGTLRLEDVTADQIETWLGEMPGKPSTRRKALVFPHYAPHEEDARLVAEAVRTDVVNAAVDTA